MNDELMDMMSDPDLRLSYQPLLHSAKRARELALQTGTLIVISRNGVMEQPDPATEAAPLTLQAAVPPYLAKP